MGKGTNLRKAEKSIRAQLKKNWAKLDFKFENEDNAFKATANLSLRNYDDNIMVVYRATSGGMAIFRAIFDAVDVNERILTLLNNFNQGESFFTAFVGKYLEIKSSTPIYNEKDVGEYLGECMARMSKMADNNYLKEIAKFTH